MPALQRAIAFAEIHGLTMPVAEDLDFDMARLIEKFLEIDGIVAEGGFGFAARHGERTGSSSAVRATFMPRPPPPAEALTRTGKPISSAILKASSLPVTAPSEPGTQGMLSRFAVRLASILSPMRRMCSGLGPMNSI